jgi:lysophospholipase L1-like esterase
VEKDVIARKPTIVFIYIGIKDVWHGEKDPKRGTLPDAFEAGLQEVIGKIQAAGAQVILCTPTVIGEKPAGNNLDEKLDAYSDISRKLAAKLKLPLCDLRKAFVSHLKENNKEGKERGVLTTDRVHLNPAGNELVAKTMLQMLEAR